MVELLELYECGKKQDLDPIKLAFAGEEVAKRGGVLFRMAGDRLPIDVLCNIGKPDNLSGTQQVIFIPHNGDSVNKNNPEGGAFYVNPEKKIFTEVVTNYSESRYRDTAHISDRYELIGDPREFIIELYRRGYLPVSWEKYFEIE